MGHCSSFYLDGARVHTIIGDIPKSCALHARDTSVIILYVLSGASTTT